MVDILALALSHGLLALAAWRLLARPDLDVEAPGEGVAPEQTPLKRSGPVRREMRWPGGQGRGEGSDDA